MTCLPHPYASASPALPSGFTIWWSVGKGSTFTAKIRSHSPSAATGALSASMFRPNTASCSHSALQLPCILSVACNAYKGPHHNALVPSLTYHSSKSAFRTWCLGSFPVAIRMLSGAPRKAGSCSPDFLGDPRLTNSSEPHL